jgi:rare lipoprotein A
MGGLGSNGTVGRLARVCGAAAACLALANCSSQVSSNIDPRYGTSASTRVVGPGEPVPKGGGVYRVGKPYTVAGRVYIPEEDVNYSAVGLASWYGTDFHGRYTANGEIFDMNSISAAHKTLPLPSYVRVTNLANRRSIVVRVNDRGPYVGDRVVDLSVKTAQLLGFYGHGVAKVKVDYVGRAPLAGSDDLKLAATLREGTPATPPVMVAANDSRNYAPAYFDARPMTQLAARAPTPPERPYRLGEGAREVAAVDADEGAPITELAAATRPQRADPVTRRALAAAEPAEPSVSPVSAYAPVRYDAPAGFMSGRGLY